MTKSFFNYRDVRSRRNLTVNKDVREQFTKRGIYVSLIHDRNRNVWLCKFYDKTSGNPFEGIIEGPNKRAVRIEAVRIVKRLRKAKK